MKPGSARQSDMNRRTASHIPGAAHGQSILEAQSADGSQRIEFRYPCHPAIYRSGSLY
jgi:hypothetical protein